MKTPRIVVAALLVICVSLCPSIASGQTRSTPVVTVAAPDVLQELTLRDGTAAIGRVEKVENGRVTFRTAGGVAIEVALDQVASVRNFAGRLVGGHVWRADSNPTRLFFAPTARSVPRGGGYAALYEGIMPFVQVGVTDRVSLGGGTPLWIGDGAHPIWFTPKVQVYNGETTQAAVGVMHFFNVDGASFGIAYGVATLGTTDSAVTVGIGAPYYKNHGYHGGNAVVMFGGEHRVSRTIKLITENYLTDGVGFLTGGLRFMGERFSADVAMVAPFSDGEFFAFPMVNFVWKFGQ